MSATPSVQDRASETAHFRGSLANIARQPEFVRASMMLVHLSTLRSCPYLTADECLSAVYGTPQAFWEIECSEPVTWSRFMMLFATLLAIEESFEYEMARMALGAALLAAHRDGADFFTGDVAALAQAQYVWQVRSEHLNIDVKSAGLWLIGKPKRVHLVPRSFRSFIDKVPGLRTPSTQPTHPPRAARGNVDAYNARVAALGRYPTFSEDAQWAREINISRDALRNLRNGVRPANLKKGGAPKRKNAVVQNLAEKYLAAKLPS